MCTLEDHVSTETLLAFLLCDLEMGNASLGTQVKTLRDAALAGPLMIVKVSARTDVQVLLFVLPHQNNLDMVGLLHIN